MKAGRRREILTPAEMYRADALAVAQGASEESLIECAGLAVAEEIVRRFGARRTMVLCGPGNNGKDGRVAARYLQLWGWSVEIGDDVSKAELIIDALYGAGLNREFPKDIADRVNSSGVPVISIDVPSGLDGLTGLPRGSSIRADITITFVRKKPAHVLYPGRDLCGEVVVADIGIDDDIVAAINPQLRENSKPELPSQSAETHKFKKGHALVWSGGEFSTGAARLAAQAALKSGAGLVSLVGDEEALRIHAAHVSAVMLKPVKEFPALLKDARSAAVCIGPGAGISAKTRAAVLAALRSKAAILLDADALTSFEDTPHTLFKAISGRIGETVLTPHEGEFLRLFRDMTDIAVNKVERARVAAKRSGAVVLLKGPDTVIAHPDGRAVVNSNGSAKLATAGSGDVLAGIITGLLAQGMDGFQAACVGAWLHADAATGWPRKPTKSR